MDRRIRICLPTYTTRRDERERRIYRWRLKIGAGWQTGEEEGVGRVEEEGTSNTQTHTQVVLILTDP